MQIAFKFLMESYKHFAIQLESSCAMWKNEKKFSSFLFQFKEDEEEAEICEMQWRVEPTRLFRIN